MKKEYRLVTVIAVAVAGLVAVVAVLQGRGVGVSAPGLQITVGQPPGGIPEVTPLDSVQLPDAACTERKPPSAGPPSTGRRAELRRTGSTKASRRTRPCQDASRANRRR